MPWKHRVETDMVTSDQTEILVWVEDGKEVILSPNALRELTAILASQPIVATPKEERKAEPEEEEPFVPGDTGTASFSPAGLAPPGLVAPEGEMFIPPMPSMERTASGGVEESALSSSSPEKLSLFKVVSQEEEEDL